MYSPKIFVLSLLLIGAQSRQIDLTRFPSYIDSGLLERDLEDLYMDKKFESVHPRVIREVEGFEDLEDLEEDIPHSRVTRQLHGSISTNPDGAANIMAKLPIAGNDKNILSAIGSGSGLQNGQYGAATGGLQLENINGHSLSVTKTHIPAFGDQLTGAGKLNLINTDNHNLNANAFITRNQPKFPGVPDFNTHGGGLDYMFKNKVGGSVGIAQTPFLQKTDYSAMGNLNLFRDKASSLDFNAGATKSISPFISNSRWQPSAGLSFTKYW